MHHPLSFLVSLSLFTHVVRGILVNVSVDDSFPDPLTGNSIQYFPSVGGTVASGNWQIGQTCKNACSADLDPSDLFNGTYHYGEANENSGSAPQSASLVFSGSAVYVMCVWASVAPTGHGDSLGNSDMTFSLNDTVVGLFSKKVNASGSGVYDYGAAVYVNEDLPPGTHSLTIQNGLAGKESVMMLDRIIYTTEVDEELGSENEQASNTLANPNVSPLPTTVLETIISSIQATLTVTGSSSLSIEIVTTQALTTNKSPGVSSKQPPVPTEAINSTTDAPLPVSDAVLGAIIAGAVATFFLLCFTLVWWRKRRVAERKWTMPKPFETQPELPYSSDVGLDEELYPPEYASRLGGIERDGLARASTGTELGSQEKN
ncbi:hypothetical protein SCHPADRAFT_382997 [Schizopora paradoxa]|uniref:Uncharacterized protein n=1 Tax=Schizopora paradoxa TaxID=27342 RepID=A0A0H2S8A4_9AGAM|nr:hypothetical protein SCHPADRAFT_382997 [Schizopora paradoxa]